MVETEAPKQRSPVVVNIEDNDDRLKQELKSIREGGMSAKEGGSDKLIDQSSFLDVAVDR